MKKLILALILLTSPLLASNWISVKDKPLPEFKEVIQYDRCYDRIVISDHISYSFYVEYCMGHSPDITHWMELPEPPIFEEDAELD